MRILLIGGRGSIGRRYEKILNFLKHKVLVLDSADKENDRKAVYYAYQEGNYDKAIICTPTNTHVEICKYIAKAKKPFLCEKPVSKNPHEIEDLRDYCNANGVDARMVCNYKFALNQSIPLKWDYYNTGKDGVYWDLIQLIYINPNIKIYSDGFIWKLLCDGATVSYQDLEMSYYSMIMQFLHKPERLWDLNDALKATERVLERIKNDTDNR